MRCSVLAIGLASCVIPAPTGETGQTGQTGETGGPAGCDGFVGSPFVPGSCPGGGVVSDLVADVRALDPSGAPCVVCDPGVIPFQVVLTNPCPIEVQVPGWFLVDFRSIASSTDPSVDGTTSMSWTSPTTGTPVAVPAGGEAEVGPGPEYTLDPGEYAVTVGFGIDVANATAAICVE